jgi:hypothetical protein
MRKISELMAGLGLVFALTISARAGTYTMIMTNAFDALPTNAPPVTTGAAGTATFQDVSSGVVDLTLAYNQGAGSAEQVSAWGIDVTNLYAQTLSFTLLSKSAGMNTPSITQSASDTQHMDGGGYYFDIFMNSFGGTFLSGDSIAFQITSSQSGLAAADFLNLSSATNTTYTPDTYYSVLQTYQNGSGKYYNLGAINVVPEPATIGLVALAGLMPLFRRRK